MTDPILTKSPSHRDMPLTEAIETMEQYLTGLQVHLQRMKFLTSNEVSKIEMEIIDVKFFLFSAHNLMRWFKKYQKATDQMNRMKPMKIKSFKQWIKDEAAAIPPRKTPHIRGKADEVK